MVASTESRARRLPVVRNFSTAESFATRARRKRCWSFWSRLARALSARVRRSSATCRAARRTSPYPTSSSATPTTRSRLLTSNGALRSIDQYMGLNIAIALRRIQNLADVVRGSIGGGKVHLERRAFARFAVQPDVATALLDDAIDGRETEPGAAADRLGRKERLEDPRLRVLIHPSAGVGDGQHHVRAR